MDRDGVINQVVFRDCRPASPRTLDEFRVIDGVSMALRRLRGAGFRLFVVTNQPDVARGLLDARVLSLKSVARWPGTVVHRVRTLSDFTSK